MGTQLSLILLLFSLHSPYMHILVDIRTLTPYDILVPRTGLIWVDMWKKYRPDDTISLLVYDYQERQAGYNYINIPKHLGPWWKKPIRPRTGSEIFRCVSFSSLEPYDPTISTIWHIWSNADMLYPNPHDIFWKRRWHEWRRRSALHIPTTIIVPDIQIGRELVEIFDVWEDQLEIIPYLPFDKYKLDTVTSFQNIIIDRPYFIYDGGYGEESGLTQLFVAWEQYKHSGGTCDLLLIGSAGNMLSQITHTLRSLDIYSSVRYLWSLDVSSTHHLYSHARGWIYTWAYYGAGPIIEQALTYDLPLLLSDIPSLRNYAGIKVHPSHTLDISNALTSLETAEMVANTYHPDSSYFEAYLKIISKK